MRIKKGISPFSGSKDHYALRLEAMGFSRKKITYASFIFSILMGTAAWLSTLVSLKWGALIYLIIGLEFLIISWHISKIRVD